MAGKTIELKIKRQDNPKSKPYWEEFSLPYQDQMNVIACLIYVVRNPKNKKGENVTPVVWESSCLEEVCGACTMLINGKVRQACAALVDPLTQPITIEPMTKFPVVRDLIVDRSRMFEELKKAKAWNTIDGTYDLGPAPQMSPEEQEYAYPMSRCMTCGCCVEVCPQYNDKIEFVGAHAVAQVDLHNVHSVGKMEKSIRLEAMMQPGGISACGKNQNCVRVCPKDIPLTTSIAKVFRDTTLYALGHWLKK
ncbi:MAG TPA: succinate dehydrogenase iron-sulfur subunit [Bdellovibrionota bacterium]|nr:succinate dehydrogenase iron-sulfur subunit [Bdellovibrionota bacterium]